MQDWVGGSTLNCVYAGAVGAGVLFSIMLLVADGLGDIFHGLEGIFNFGDVDGHDIGGGEGHGISMISIATFVTTFGAGGLITTIGFEANAITSLVVAIIGGVVFGGLAQMFFIYVLSPTTNSVVNNATLEGKIAEVITPVPKDGMGQIVLVAQGGRVTYSAQSYNGEPLRRGTEVRIEKIIGNVATVTPTSEYEP
jgi:membrane-bound ClpP family serine protease